MYTPIKYIFWPQDSFFHSFNHLANIEFLLYTRHSARTNFFFSIQLTHYMFTFLFLPTKSSFWRTQTLSVLPAIKHLIFIVQYFLKRKHCVFNSYELALLEEKENKRNLLRWWKKMFFTCCQRWSLSLPHHSSLQAGASASLLVFSCKEHGFCISSACSLPPKPSARYFRAYHRKWGGEWVEPSAVLA